MAKLTPDLLARCLADVESGRRTVEECLAAHPAVAGELRPLLEVALSIASPPPVTPDAAFRRRGRAALLAAVAADKERAASSPLWHFWQALRAGWVPPSGLAGRRTGLPALVAVLVVALAVASGGGAIYAAQDTLPGDTLYPVKTAVEQVQLAVATADEARARTYLDLARKRLAEIETANRRGRAAAASAAAEAFVAHVDQADAHLIQATGTGKDVSALANSLAKDLARHQTALARAGQRAAPPAQAALAKAAAAAAKGLTVAGVEDDGGPAAERDSLPADAGRRPVADVSTAVSMTEAISDVQRLASDPNLPGKSFGGLISKLKAVQAALGRGQDDVAVRLLDAFLAELNAMRRSGNIGSEDYDTLYARYSATVNSLGGTPKAQVAPNESGAGGQPAIGAGSERQPEEENWPAGGVIPRGQPKEPPTRVPSRPR